MPTRLQQRMFKEMAEKAIFQQAQDYAFSYLDSVFDQRVYPNEEAIGELACFAENRPRTMTDADKVLQQLHEYGSPATVAQIGGRYFGFVNGSVIPAALAARWLSDIWDQNSALYVISPLTSKLEEVCESWLKEIFSLPDRVTAGFVSGSSLAIFCGLAAARYRVLQKQNWDINRQGLNGAPPVRVVAGKQAHGTVVKAISLLGLGQDNIEWVNTDEQGRIIASQVPELDQRTILILQAGNVASGSFDPFDELCTKANQANAWVHIDGAFGLWAAGCGELRYLSEGMEKANSWSVDGHKTLNTPYDNGIILCDDREALVKALHASGSYIAYSDHRDGMLFTPEMSRRARAIELWAALKYLGEDGLDQLVSGLHERALQIGDELEWEGFRILNEVVFNQVLVSCGADELNLCTMRHIQQSGECWVGGTLWNDETVIRISVCSWATTEQDISRSVRAFVQAREKAEKELSNE